MFLIANLRTSEGAVKAAVGTRHIELATHLVIRDSTAPIDIGSP
jgi:hypothetical protein